MSLRIEYNTSTGQTMIYTLAESLSAITSGETFYFVFENEQSKEKYYKTLEDESLYPNRYNKFIITTLTGNTTTSNIPFDLEGWYKYKVYKGTTGTTLLELGKCYVYDNNTPVVESYDPTTTKKVYKK